MHYTEGIVRGLQASGANCNMQKREGSADYFGDPAGIAYGQQDCSGCASSLTRCTHPDTQVRTVQQLQQARMLHASSLLAAAYITWVVQTAAAIEVRCETCSILRLEVTENAS
jgi:hypothetical protein